MALNPPLSWSGDPAPVEGEYFVLRRGHIEAEVQIGPQKYKGDGQLFLTTARLVFVNKKVNI
eukprot:CAMPEP_0201281530 /NCGR_PEP_ID=MMETSP1317-20130820/3138_1 /ASSEMBLY_ACC=CAM_ASM_000770 /TAXON_ID=187299 /ORGANISM="Undescribed Undescribed, Strain Undescribed" /LENGTH=61 /DNA_ID=CAMNT_0047591569 /DNA_START=46 /DNA_END=231 /DNA_ORIENTATION=-